MREVDPNKYRISIILRGQPPKTRIFAELTEEELYFLQHRRMETAGKIIQREAQVELDELRKRKR